MSTYPTYQATKIANPDKDIHKSELGFFADENLSDWSKCNPADYCMTVEQFLNAGSKFVSGDLTINDQGKVGIVGIVDTVDAFNTPDSEVDSLVLVLRAAADEETKTYRYEKVTDTGFFELKDEFQGRMIFFNQSVTSTPDYAVAMDIIELSHHFMQKNLYRRIEVTEKELAIEHAAKIMYDADQSSGQINDLTLGALFDAGMLKLVNGKG